MDALWEHVKVLAWNSVWAANLAAMSRPRAGATRVLQMLHMVGRELGSGQLTTRAASLVYTTLLSLVPALAVTFAVLKAFNVHHELQPVIVNFLEPFGDQGVVISMQIIDFVEHLDLARLGYAGLAFLLFTIVSLVHKIEQALNYIWRVERPRKFFERLSGYVTVVMVGPLLVFTALGIGASILQAELVRDAAAMAPVRPVVDVVRKVVPYLLVIAAFTAVYVYMPNTRVRVRSALFGGVVAGFLWASASWAFGSMVVGSSRYAVIYSGFAIAVLSMMWLYFAWLILLVGGCFAFYHQNPEFRGLTGAQLHASNRVRERLGLSICLLIARQHQTGGTPWNAVTLSRRLDVPLTPLRAMLRALVRADILVATAGEPPGYVPGRDPATVTVREVLAVLRAAEEVLHLRADHLQLDDAAGPLMAEVERGMDEVLGERTLRSVVRDSTPPPSASVTPIKA